MEMLLSLSYLFISLPFLSLSAGPLGDIIQNGNLSDEDKITRLIEVLKSGAAVEIQEKIVENNVELSILEWVLSFSKLKKASVTTKTILDLLLDRDAMITDKAILIAAWIDGQYIPESLNEKVRQKRESKEWIVSLNDEGYKTFLKMADEHLGKKFNDHFTVPYRDIVSIQNDMIEFSKKEPDSFQMIKERYELPPEHKQESNLWLEGLGEELHVFIRFIQQNYLDRAREYIL